jgi:crotonobetaine/carnitine-CoA ligase
VPHRSVRKHADRRLRSPDEDGAPRWGAHRPTTRRDSSYEPGVDPTSSWRDGWFHTGDLFIESDGEYRFVGRVKDSIRRNGRNISAQDLEDEVRMLPGVDQCVCVGYCEAGTVEEASRDDEIRLFVVPETPGKLDAESLVASLRERLSVYMLPRYVDIVSELPRTENGKLSRHTLRQMPLTPDTFDRKATVGLTR